MIRIMQRSIVRLALVLLLAGAATLSAQTSITVSPASVSLSALTGSTAAVSQQLAISIASTSAAAQGFLVTANSTGWLSVSPQTGNVSPSAPATVTVSANPTGLATNTYTGSLQVFLTGAVNSPVTVNVTLTVGPISAQSTPIAFTYQQGGSAPPAQPLQVNAVTSTNFTAAATTVSGGNWLQVAPTSGTAPSTVLSVSLNTSVLATLAAGNYSGNITLTAPGASPVQVPVTLAVTAVPQLNASPASLSFAFQSGGTNNVVQQTVALSSSSSTQPLAFTYSVTASSWLSVTPSSNTTPATLTVTVNPGTLPAGPYTGSIILTAPGAANSPLTIPVSLLVSATPLMTVTPAALTFNWQFGTALPSGQSIQTSSTGAAISYTAGVSANTPWLAVSPTTGSTPTPITVSVTPGNLTPGVYPGIITITPAGGTPQTVTVTLNVSASPIPLINAVGPLDFNFQTNQTPPQPQTIQVVSSTGAPLNLNVSTGGAAWLFVTPTSGITPATLSISVQTAGMAPGTNDADITVSATVPGAGTPTTQNATIHVRYFVSNFAMLNVATSTSTPGLLSLTSVAGGPPPAAPTIALTSTNPALPLTYTAIYAATPGSPLVVTLQSQNAGSGVQITSTTPDNITVNVQQPTAPGQYSGTITITATDPTTNQPVPNSPQTVSVQLLVAAGTLNVTPAAGLTFSQTLGTAPPPAQTIQVNGTGAALNFSVSTSTDVAVPWLKVTPTSGATNIALGVTVDATNLSPGTYHGYVSILAPGAAGSPFTLPVVFTVNAQGTLAVTPATLPFVVQAGGQAPPSQTVQVSSSSAVSFTVTSSTASGGSWLKVTPTSGTTTTGVATALTVSVDPTSLAAGNYTGTITITAPGATNSPQAVNVTLQVQGLPAPVITGATNAASFAVGRVSPGELISLFGTNVGPTAITTLQLTAGGTVATTLANTQVLFDGIAAPLVAVSSTQINAIVPYEVAGRQTTNVTVQFNGQTSAQFQLGVTDSMPGIFTQNVSGSGPGAILNQNLSVNTAANPAKKGSTIAIFATGEGQTAPAGVDGKVMSTTLAKPLLPVTVLIGGQVATVQYDGSAPTLVAGVLQVNAVVPTNIASGSAVPVIIIVGSASSQANVTLAVQ